MAPPLVVEERTSRQPWPPGHPREQPVWYLRPIALLGNFYSSQLPEGKVQTYDLERLGESREPSWRVCCRQLSCLGRFHHYLHHCSGCFTFYRRVSGQKILLSVCMLSLGLPQVECEFCGGKASSVLVYHWILQLNSTWTSRYLIPVTNCPHFCSVYSHTLREEVGAVFSLKWGDPWEELSVLPHVCTELS